MFKAPGTGNYSSGKVDGRLACQLLEKGVHLCESVEPGPLEIIQWKGTHDRGESWVQRRGQKP